MFVVFSMLSTNILLKVEVINRTEYFGKLSGALIVVKMNLLHKVLGTLKME